MTVYYLEIVTRDVDGVCSAYAPSLGSQFGDPDPRLGGARTAGLSGGGLVGVRGPLREDEEPTIRPYWLVEDIHGAVADVEAAGGVIALPPMEIPDHGTIAIYQLGGSDHGLWQRP